MLKNKAPYKSLPYLTLHISLPTFSHYFNWFQKPSNFWGNLYLKSPTTYIEYNIKYPLIIY